MAANDFERDPLMCYICVNICHRHNDGVVDADLETIFACVVPICATSMSKGATLVVGRYLPISQTLLKRLNNARRSAASATLHAKISGCVG